MRAWTVRAPAPIDDGPLVLGEVADPEPGPGEVRVRVRCCGVCRTDLHVAEGDLAVRRPNVIPGHEVVGVVDRVGPDVQGWTVGDRLGIAWLRATCGACRPCRSGRENLCLTPRFTGWTDDGGYAEHAVVPAAFAHRLPDDLGDLEAAPLLCAGIIGYRALLRSGFEPGDRLGIWGFGASAHLTAQLATALGGELFVVTRSEEGRQLARRLGAAWVGSPGQSPPTPLDAAISFAPAGEVVPEALGALGPGGVLALAGIHVTTIPPLEYARTLFDERELRSVTANTRADADRFLTLAARCGLQVTTAPYPFTEADRALQDLAADRFAGAAVLDLT